MKPTFNLTLWRWEIDGAYCSPERALSLLGMEFYSHQRELAQAAGYRSITELLDARQRAAWHMAA
jgi:hypothetical protein